MTVIQGEEILSWEQDARRTGLSVKASQLSARWNLDQVFDRKGRSGGAGQSAILRAIGACLILEHQNEDESNTTLLVSNQVRLGPMVLRFEGDGALVGQRPLLQFSFKTLVIKFGERTVHQRQISPPPAAKMPFFALIKIDNHQGFLAARGRGGGLALWKRQPL